MDAKLQQIILLKTSLDEYRTFYIGLQTYTAGVSEINSEFSSLKTGLENVNSGVGMLSSGTEKSSQGLANLDQHTQKLCEGIAFLKNGSTELSKGLTTLNEEGIKKLFDNNISLFFERLKIISEISKQYTNFSGISEEMKGKIKFIYRTESIK